MPEAGSAPSAQPGGNGREPGFGGGGTRAFRFYNFRIWGLGFRHVKSTRTRDFTLTGFVIAAAAEMVGPCSTVAGGAGFCGVGVWELRLGLE